MKLKISYKKILLLETLFLMAILFCNFVLKISSTYNHLILITLFIFILSVIFIGYEKDRFRFKKDIFLTVLIYSVGFLIITYVSSFFVGYLRSAYSLKFTSILRNAIPPLLLMILCELNRYNFVTKSKGFKIGIIFISVIMVAIDLYYPVQVKLFSGTGRDIIEFICGDFLTSIAKNILLTYLTYKVGFRPAIVYRLIFETTDYILPIFPGFGDYMQIVFDIVFPVFLFLKVRKMLNYDKKKTDLDVRRNNKVFNGVTIGGTILIVILVVLTSGIFTYHAVAVASNSMAPMIERGDVVIAKKLKVEDIRDLEEGEILFFNHDDRVVLHRIIDKWQDGSVTYFQTKGDNNPTADNYIISERDVVGKIVAYIPYIGMPTVWLSELIN